MENEENKINRIGFFKKTWNSIIKIEKYPDMAAEGLSSAITYLFKIVAILALVLCLGTIYQIHEVVKDGVSIVDRGRHIYGNYLLVAARFQKETGYLCRNIFYPGICFICLYRKKLCSKNIYQRGVVSQCPAMCI